MRSRTLILSVGSFGAALFVAAAYLWLTLPNVEILKNHYPVVRHQGRNLPPIVELKKGRPGNWVPISLVSKSAVTAIVISEDWAFYQHGGLDFNQIKEAIREDLEEGRFARGASTITQQVAKNVFLERDKTLLRKGKELLLALRLEKIFRKSKILELYLNVAEWGPGVYGIGAAAHHYFGKSPAELSAKEGAFLAMLLPSPIRYSQSFRDKRLTVYAKRTIEAILDKMVQANYLTEEDFAAELSRPLSFEAE